MTFLETLINPMVYNYPMILGSMTFFFLIQHLSLTLAFRFSKTFRGLTPEEKADFGVRITAFVHSFVTLITIPGYLFPKWEWEFLHTTSPIQEGFLKFANWVVKPSIPEIKEFGGPDGKGGIWTTGADLYSPVSQVFFAWTCGYFMWDLFICISQKWGRFYIFHGVISCGVYYFGLRPFIHDFGRFYHGVFELSTCFIHIREVLAMMKKQHWLLCTLSGVLFVATYSMIRIACGTLVSWQLAQTMWNLIGSPNCHSDFVVWFMLVSVIGMMTLQYFWFWTILKVTFGTSTVSRNTKIE